MTSALPSIEMPRSGRRTFCTLNEGLGKVLRYGAYSDEVITRLRFMADVLGPLLGRTLAALDRIGHDLVLGVAAADPGRLHPS